MSLIQVMEKLGLGFSLPQMTSHEHLEDIPPLLIPELLPKEKPTNCDKLWESLDLPNVFSRRFIFKFLPVGAISRIFVVLLKIPFLQPLAYWHDHIMMNLKGEAGFLFFEQNILTLTVKSQGTTTILRSVVRRIENLLDSWFSWYRNRSSVDIPVVHPRLKDITRSKYVKKREILGALTSGKGHVEGGMRVDLLAPDIILPNINSIFIDTKEIELDTQEEKDKGKNPHLCKLHKKDVTWIIQKDVSATSQNVSTEIVLYWYYSPFVFLFHTTLG